MGKGGYYKDEEIDGHIKTMTKMFWRKDGSEVIIYPEPYGKNTPQGCDHCERLMTKTGRLPAMKDWQSWYHWKRWESGGEGIRKIYRLNDSVEGDVCVDCHNLHIQWSEEYEAQAKAEGRLCYETDSELSTIKKES